MDKGLIGFLLVFVLLIGAGLAFANTDQITPTVVQAQAEISAGLNVVRGFEQGAMWVGKILLGAFFAGIAAAVYTEVRKAYRAWLRNGQARRWQPGPNAQWKEPHTAKTPSLRREDLMLLALMNGRMPQGLRPVRSRAAGVPRPDSGEEEVNLEF